jgi:hypothetical protein
MMSFLRPVARTAWRNSMSSPGVDRSPVERLVLRQEASEFRQRRSLTGGDVDGRVHDEIPKALLVLTVETAFFMRIAA